MSGSLSAQLARDPVAAAREAVRMLADARRDGREADIGRLAYVVAQARSREGRNAEALSLIDEAQHAHRLAGNAFEAVRIVLGRMSVLNEMGRHHDALVAGGEAQQALAALELDIDDRWLAAALQKNCGLTLGLLGRHHEAIDAYVAAATQFEVLGLQDELPSLWHNQAVETMILGHPEDALRGFRRAARGHQRAGDLVSATESRRDGANTLVQLGRFTQGLGVLRAARATFVGLGMSPEVARTDLSIGEASLLLGQLDEARGALQSAAEEFENLGMPHDQAVALLLLGQTLARQQRRDEARSALRRSGVLADACDDQALWCSAQLFMADLPAASGDGAPDHLGAALQRVDAERWPVHAAMIHLRAVHMAIDADQHDAARRHLRHARMAARRAARADVERALDHASGRLGLRTGRLSQAIADLRRAVESLEAGTADLHDPIVRLGYLDGQVAPHDDLSEAYRIAGDARASLDVLEQRKAQVLVTQLRAHSADAGGAATERLRDRGPHERVDLDALGDAALVSWLATDDSLTARIAHDGKVRSVDLGPAAPVMLALSQLEAQWVRMRGQSAHAHRFAERLAETADHLLALMHDRLIAPLELPDGVPLIASPDGPIAHAPFAALGGREAPLMRRHPITVAASGLLIDEHAAAPRGDAQVLLVAPTPDQLPASRTEVMAAADSHPASSTLIGAQATAAGVRQAVASAEIVHLACHGRFRDDAPFASEVLLADGWVPATELMTWDWSDRIVVLSACAVGRSAALGGERVGMSRVLLGAGARAVVVAKWDIPDAATSRLLADVHAGLADRVPVRDALRDAQIVAAAASDHPASWAAFEVIHR